MPTATISFDQTEADVVALQRQLFGQGTYRRQLFAPAIWSGLVAALFTSVSAIALGAADSDALRVFATAALIFIVLTALALWWGFNQPRALTKRVLADSALRLRSLGSQTVTLTPEGLEWTHPVGHGMVEWRGVSAIERRPKALYILVGPSSGVPIPSRAFATDAAFHDFADMAEQLWADAHRHPQSA